MKIFLYISLVALVFIAHGMRDYVSEFSYNLQKTCLSYSPKDLQQHETLAALVCGSKLKPKSEIQQIMVQAQLIHIIVVSGSHLQVLQNIFQFFKVPRVFINLLLILYSLLTGFQPPCVRALLLHFFRSLNQSYHWSIHPISLQIYVTLILLTVFPEWIHSFSFTLSCLASMALSFPIWKFKNKAFNEWQRTLLVHIFVCGMMSAFSFKGFLANLLFAPLVGWGLFPLALSIYAVHLFYDQWDLFLTSLHSDFYWNLPITLISYLKFLFDGFLNTLLTTLKQLLIFPLQNNMSAPYLVRPWSVALFWILFLIPMQILVKIREWKIRYFDD